MMRWLILLGLVGFCACKSVKKREVRSLSLQSDSVSHRVSDETLARSLILEELLTDHLQVTRRTQTYETQDSSGVTVFKPRTEEVILSRTAEAKRSVQDSTYSEVSSGESGSVKSSESASADLDSDVEMQSILGSLLDAITPSWSRVVLSFLVVIIPVISAYWLRRKSKKENDGIPPA